jgi:hypothetical protein
VKKLLVVIIIAVGVITAMHGLTQPAGSIPKPKGGMTSVPEVKILLGFNHSA